jgi:transcriptional regulator with XRE-family HTH domain
MENRIRELREARHLTLDQVAAAAETSRQQVHRLETGARRLTVGWMRRLAPVLAVPPAALLIDPVPERVELAKNYEEEVLLRWWRKLPRSEQNMIATMALARGFNIVAGLTSGTPSDRSAA